MGLVVGAVYGIITLRNDRPGFARLLLRLWLFRVVDDDVIDLMYDDSVNDLAYLDISAFKRPFDDTAAERVLREAEAVAAVLDAVSTGHVRLVRSPAHDFENDRNPREDRRMATSLWLRAANVRVPFSNEAAERARELTSVGFSPLDALHLAFAENAGAHWFVTTDDRLLKLARANARQLRVEPLNRVELPFLIERGNS